MMMTAELLKMVNLLEENSIEYISFKGPTLSQMAYDDITLRQYVDLDILIKEDDFDEVINILMKLNYKNKYDYSKAKEKIKELISDHMFYNLSTGTVIEIHNKLFSSNFPLNIKDSDFINNKISMKINNKNVFSFSKEYLLVYLCLHGSKHLFSRISWILDIHKFIENHDIDWIGVNDLIEKYNIKTFVNTSLFLSLRLFNTKLPDHMKTSYKLKNKKLVQSILFNKKNMEFEDRFSFIHLFMFDTFTQKIQYILYIFKPTFLDYQSLNKETRFNFLYYLYRPYNILSRFLKNQNKSE